MNAQVSLCDDGRPALIRNPETNLYPQNSTSGLRKRGEGERKGGKGEVSFNPPSKAQTEPHLSSLLHNHPPQCVPESVILVLDVERSSCQSGRGTVELKEKKEGKEEKVSSKLSPSTSS